MPKQLAKSIVFILYLAVLNRSEDQEHAQPQSPKNQNCLQRVSLECDNIQDNPYFHRQILSQIMPEKEFCTNPVELEACFVPSSVTYNKSLGRITLLTKDNIELELRFNARGLTMTNEAGPYPYILLHKKMITLIKPRKLAYLVFCGPEMLQYQILEFNFCNSNI